MSFYIAIAPWLVGFVLFFAGPMVISLLTSFTDWDLLTDPMWVGLDNYRDLATDRLFLQSIKVTLAYTAAYVPLDLIGGLLLALLVRPRLKGIGIFRTIFYLPTVFSGVAFVVVWLWMLNPNGGLINLVTILIGSQIKGDVLHNPGLGYALALGMVVVMAVSMAIYYVLRRRSERWLRL